MIPKDSLDISFNNREQIRYVFSEEKSKTYSLKKVKIQEQNDRKKGL
jgi:hypothetical protein